MIILQLLSLMLLIPLSPFLLLFFNLYVKNWFYQLLILIFGIIYSGLWGILFNSLGFAIFIFTILVVTYIFRIRDIITKIKSKANHTKLYGNIKYKNNFNLIFYFPLSILRIIKKIPGICNIKLNKRIELCKLLDFILYKSIGTSFEIINNKSRIHLEIQ